jgi:hypothetical protein
MMACLMSRTTVTRRSSMTTPKGEYGRSFGRDVGTMFADERRIQTFTVAFDPVMTRPWRARHERRQVLPSGTKLSFTDTTFDWARAVGCRTVALD